jgi:site-specific recombinase
MDDVAPALPNVVFGTILLVSGLVTITFRRRLYARTVSLQNDLVGQRAGRAIARRQSSFWIGVAGLWGVLLGIAMISYAIVTIAAGR